MAETERSAGSVAGLSPAARIADYLSGIAARAAEHEAREAEKTREACEVRAEVEAQNAAYLAGLRLAVVSD